MSMHLQIALDRLTLDEAIRVTAATAPHTDWIEVGTSMVKAHGMDGVRRIVNAAEGRPVLVDTKTMDDGRTEIAMCVTAGANAASVMAVAEPRTLDICVEAAAQYQCELMVDLMACSSPRRDELVATYADQRHLVWALHVPKDNQNLGRPTADQLRDEVITWPARQVRLAGAGGLDERSAPTLAGYVERVIVGSAITAAPDPAIAAERLRKALRATERS